MNNRIRLLKRIRSVRERVRDAAAGVLETAESKRLDALAEQERAQGRMTELLDEGPQVFGRAATINTFVRYDGERRLTHRYVQVTRQETSAAAATCDRLRLDLRQKEKQLRVAEKLLDESIAERERAVRKEEQKLADDISGERVARRKE